MAKLLNKKQEEFIKKHAKGLYNKELTEKLNKEFNTNFSKEQIKGYKHRNKISSGLTGHFQKGHTPANKGKKMSKEEYEKCKDTMFKKGQIPHNKRPVGSERYGKDFYILIKVAEPNKWMLKHRYIYEQHHGALEKGYAVIFADGNKYNFDIDNLIAVKRRELIIINQYKLIKKGAPHLTDTGVKLAKLKDMIRIRRNTKKK